MNQCRSRSDTRGPPTCVVDKRRHDDESRIVSRADPRGIHKQLNLKSHGNVSDRVTIRVSVMNLYDLLDLNSMMESGQVNR